MKTLRSKTSLLAVAVLGFCSSLHASDKQESSYVVFQSPEKFTDILSAGENRKKFHPRLAKSFDDYIGKLSEELPKGYKLNLVFTDIDLAGRVEYLHDYQKEMRIVSNAYWPRLDFIATVTADGNTVLSEKVELKDMNFWSRFPRGWRKNDSLRYEKHMLKEWFDEQLKPALDAKQKS